MGTCDSKPLSNNSNNKQIDTNSYLNNNLRPYKPHEFYNDSPYNNRYYPCNPQYGNQVNVIDKAKENSQNNGLLIENRTEENNQINKIKKNNDVKKEPISQANENKTINIEKRNQYLQLMNKIQ